MSCNKLQAYLLGKIDGSLSPDLRAVVDGHLALCDECRRAWGQTQEILTTLKNGPQQSVPADVWIGIAARTVDRRGQVLPALRGIHRWWAAFMDAWDEETRGRKTAFSSAIAVLLVISVTWGTWSYKQPSILPVIEVTGNPVRAFPAYFREHHRPANQPITDGTMILAFNTSGDNR